LCCSNLRHLCRTASLSVCVHLRRSSIVFTVNLYNRLFTLVDFCRPHL